MRVTELRTERLVLRSPRIGDVEDLHRVFSDPRAMAYWSKPPFTDAAQTKGYVEAVLRSTALHGAEFVIERDGRVIGKAGYWRRPEVGFILHPDHWGQGVGTETLQALLSHGFDNLMLDRVIADVDPRNGGSLALLGKLGFVETGREKGTIEINGVWCDSVYLALEREKWKGPPAES